MPSNDAVHKVNTKCSNVRSRVRMEVFTSQKISYKTNMKCAILLHRDAPLLNAIIVGSMFEMVVLCNQRSFNNINLPGENFVRFN